MTALAHFGRSIAAADHLVSAYGELRRHRNLGARGRLESENSDLLSMPRAAVVASMSALDAYIHAVLSEQIAQLLRHGPVPEGICALMAEAISIRSGKDFRGAIGVLTAADSIAEIFSKVLENTLAVATYQAPAKINSAYELIGHPNIFGSVAGLWPGPGTDADDIKRHLAAYWKRRDQIAHEGDQEIDGSPRPMQPQYAHGCRGFVAGLVMRLDRVVYGP